MSEANKQAESGSGPIDGYLPWWPDGAEELDDYLSMDCPVSCTGCGRMVELHDCTFQTEYCDCGPWETCQHGFCSKCCEELGP